VDIQAFEKDRLDSICERTLIVSCAEVCAYDSNIQVRSFRCRSVMGGTFGAVAVWSPTFSLFYRTYPVIKRRD
jgi:hypothetical protein